ncbi:MAG: VWA domain-containing protein, partial [Verrucomicrobiota bacterium]
MVIYEHVFPGFLIVLGLIAALVIGGYSYWKFLPKTMPTMVIAGLYVIFLLVLTWCLLLPGRKTTETHTLKPRFIVALDTSESMMLSPSEDISNRWDVARQALNMPWAKSVSAECEIDVYTFHSDVSKKFPLKKKDEFTPEGKATLLRDALGQITDRYVGMNVAGGLLLTDGIDTREAFDDWAAEPRPFPIHTANLELDGNWDIEPDLRVDAVSTPKRVTLDWKTELKAVISGQGTEGDVVGVRLFKDGVMQQELPTQVPEDGGSRQVVFELTHNEIGVFTYRVFVPPLEGESNTNDNEYAVSVQVIDAKNRLIYVEGPPRWESKYLKRALQANRQATPLIFITGPGGKPRSFGSAG